MSYSRRGRVRQIVSNVKRFHHGEWKDLWETDVCFARKETDNNTKRNHTLTKCNTSIQTRVVHEEDCTRWGALSKVVVVIYYHLSKLSVGRVVMFC